MNYLAGTYVPAAFFDCFDKMSDTARTLFVTMNYLSWGQSGKPELRTSIESLAKFCGIDCRKFKQTSRSIPQPFPAAYSGPNP